MLKAVAFLGVALAVIGLGAFSIVRLQGEGSEPETAFAAGRGSLAFSPDGRHLLITEYAALELDVQPEVFPERQTVHIVDLASGETRVLIDDAAWAWPAPAAQWSPRGDQVAYVNDADELCIMSLSEEKPSCWSGAEPPLLAFSWAPEGERIIVSAGGTIDTESDNGRLYLFSVARNQAEDLEQLGGTFGIVWSDDGRQIAYRYQWPFAHDSIRVWQPGVGKPRELLRTEEGMSRLLAWLPSGEIAYQGPDGEGLFYLAPDGRTRLVPGACPAERKCQGKLIGSDYAQWTPSGGRVAVAGWNSRKRIAIFLGSSQGRDWRQVVELPVTKEVRALAVADSGQVAYIEGDRSAYGVEYEERVILVSADGKHQTLAISK